jgi:hypothetical protein|nr:MAG TPA: Essential protein Yae1, N terminal [Caudoviricetes sp.]
MSSSSYLGHGAKYWAEKYFEQQTQTRIPDNSSAIEWRDKYLSLEKSCSLYQSTIADLRTEVADLREKAQCESKPEIFQGQTAEYWYNAYKNSEVAYSKLSFKKLESRLQEDTPTRYKGSTAKEWANICDNANAQIASLQKELLSSKTHIAAMNDTYEIHGHDALYWYGNASDCQEALNFEKRQKKQIILLAIFLIIGIFFSGLLLGEGYFVPHFTPASPYITSIQESARSSGYDDGYRIGKKDSFRDAYNSGKKNGYEQGYSDGLNRRSKDSTRWTSGDVAALRESLSNTSK